MTEKTGPDYSATLYLPKTDFPMRAGLPKKEPELLAHWEQSGLTEKMRRENAGKPKFVLHDGPPYANGNIHIGHALNKILKDIVTRSQRMMGKDANYVPGWDCHGLPIEWKIEEQYRAKGRNKDEVPVVEFRRECRAFAEHWLDVQREEFKRLGVAGDWNGRYATMDYAAESVIAREIMKFAANGLLYRGSKPVMWSVVEKTALAEAEVEYEDHTSDWVFVAFPARGQDYRVVIWTTTPWTLPGNRAISFSHRIAYGLYRVTAAPEGNWAKAGELYVLADKLAESVLQSAKVEAFERVRDLPASELAALTCAHPLEKLGYSFDVPLLDGDHVTDDAGAGFVHTAPGHGREDFDIWMASGRLLHERGIDTRIPYTVDADGFYTDEVPGFANARVIDDKGNKGDANPRVIAALIEAGALLARGKMKHQYPHSWRSKKPVIFRNTPQWFIAMDKPFAVSLDATAAKGVGSNQPTLRAIALEEIARTKWVPAAGENRITGMIANRPDWVVSRQRAWGVPIAVFVKKGGHEILADETVNARVVAAFAEEGADAWYKPGAAERFLAPDHDPADFDKIDDVLDVWFDSGSTHAFTLEDPVHFPGLSGIHRLRDGGEDEIMYLEGSDQHRGWFHSSLLESCGTRGRAPYDSVLTHGFARREGAQDVEVARQCGRAPDGDQGRRRRYPAPLGRGLGLFGRPAHRQGNPRDLLRNLSQAAQHDPLDARRARPFRSGGGRRQGGHAGAGALYPAPSGRDRLSRPRGLCGLRLQEGGRAAVVLHDRRPLGPLFRHSQGRTLLRSAVERDPQGGADDNRHPQRRAFEMAGPDPLLHGGGSLARLPAGERGLRPSDRIPRRA